ncbi:sensor histidine kinase [Sphingomonas sp.]|uniref:sensor histidine kinase n=1 Tax=Sphingomonas sp. TaxID=28214 RepID=UPI001B132371|nr:sensor histidine kinase [Sphingomonas sp.]MBO9713831.1 hypothetical protein [Sphingomonas sp.]
MLIGRIARGRLTAPVLMLMAVLPGLAVRAAPDRDPGRFKHLAFPIDRGAPPDVGSLGQGPDGDLWIASTSGLFRFDGLRFERFRATGPEQLRSDMIYSMFVDRAGRIWVGYYSGGASVIENGRVRHFAEGLPKGPLKQFVEDRQGRIWAVSVRGIAYHHAGRWHAVATRPEDGTPYVLLLARDGTLWIATGKALLFVRPGGATVERTSVAVEEAWALAQGPDGRLWLSDEARGTRPIAPRPGTPPPDGGRPAQLHPLIAHRLLFDRAGNLWAALERQPGIVRIPRPGAIATGTAIVEGDIAAWYRQGEAGLTSDLAAPLFEDRHGIVWAGTRLGIDEFMPVNFVPRPEIAKVPRTGFRAIRAPDGSIAVADDSTIYRYAPDERIVTKIAYPGVARNFCADSRSRIFLASDAGLVELVGGAAVRVPLPESVRTPVVLACQVDRAGNLWLLTRQDGVFVRRGAGWTRAITPEAIGAASPRLMLIDRQDRLWLGADGSGVARYAGGRLHRFGPAEGLAIGFVQTALPVREGVVLGGELGLALFDGTRFRSLTQRDHPGLSLIAGLAQDGRGDLWISGNRGVAVFRDTPLASLFAASPDMRRFVQLDFRNGLPGYPQIACCTNTVLASRAGNLWFLTNQGVAWLDPLHLDLLSTAVAPAIRAVASGETSLPASGSVRLRAGSPNLRIDYTSDSLSNADQVEFRYRLVGIDDRWVDAGQRRQAFYPALPNGRYEFKLQARLPGGEWSVREAEVAFMVPPTFLQTPWPWILALLAAMLLIAGLWWLRMRHAMELLEKRLEERGRERERIARDLHDTLLQSVQALVLRIDLAKQEMPAEMPARDELETALGQAEQVLDEARDTVRGLRPVEGAGGIEEILRDVARRQAFDREVGLVVVTAGDPRPLAPEVRDETVRIANEALFNVWRHAAATRVEVGLRYDAAGFEMAIADNGVGIPADILASGERKGHFGLIGMRERAQRLGAGLKVESEAGRGTRVVLAVPAAKAFASGRETGWGRLRRLATEGRKSRAGV